jgi:uncharacterized membrane protein (UPF0127 family)
MISGTIHIDNNIFESLFALSDLEQMNGLMYCEADHPIMSFIYKYPKINKFWMKNVPVPLDIVFCCNGEVNQICYGKPLSTVSIGNDYYSDLVIELPVGMVEKSQIKLGHKANIIKPKKFPNLITYNSIAELESNQGESTDLSTLIKDLKK